MTDGEAKTAQAIEKVAESIGSLAAAVHAHAPPRPMAVTLDSREAQVTNAKGARRFDMLAKHPGLWTAKNSCGRLIFTWFRTPLPNNIYDSLTKMADAMIREGLE